jgi:hypothetical protein
MGQYQGYTRLTGGGPNHPKSPQNSGQKEVKKRSKRGHFWVIFGSFLGHFWVIFDPFLVIF